MKENIMRALMVAAIAVIIIAGVFTFAKIIQSDPNSCANRGGTYVRGVIGFTCVRGM